MTNYTSIWKDYQIRATTYLDGVERENEYDIVKWADSENIEHFIDDEDKKISNRYCYSIGRLTWNEKEECMDFESVGTRYLEQNEPDLNMWVLNFCERIKIEKGGCY